MNPAQTNQPGLHRLSTGLVPDIADSIPVHTPRDAASPVSEDDELDKIMRDVGNQLKADDNQPVKKRISFTVRPKQKADVKFSAQPIVPPPIPKPATLIPRPDNKTASDKARPKASTTAPVFVIFVAVVVTVVLVAASIAAYKK